MKITREELKHIVGEVLQEESDYQHYFNTMLKKHGVESPSQFKSDEERKKFFNKVDAGWDAVHERIKTVRAEQTARVEALRKEEEARQKELDEINSKIDSAIEALESLRPTEEDDSQPASGIKESNPVKKK